MSCCAAFHAAINAIFSCSHRFSTVRAADLIVVMQDGSVAEQGTHEDLMAAGGDYAELFELQARGYREERGKREGTP